MQWCVRACSLHAHPHRPCTAAAQALGRPGRFPPVNLLQHHIPAPHSLPLRRRRILGRDPVHAHRRRPSLLLYNPFNRALPLLTYHDAHNSPLNSLAGAREYLALSRAHAIFHAVPFCCRQVGFLNIRARLPGQQRRYRWKCRHSRINHFYGSRAMQPNLRRSDWPHSPHLRSGMQSIDTPFSAAHFHSYAAAPLTAPCAGSLPPRIHPPVQLAISSSLPLAAATARARCKRRRWPRWHCGSMVWRVISARLGRRNFPTSRFIRHSRIFSCVTQQTRSIQEK